MGLFSSPLNRESGIWPRHQVGFFMLFWKLFAGLVPSWEESPNRCILLPTLEMVPKCSRDPPVGWSPMYSVVLILVYESLRAGSYIAILLIIVCQFELQYILMPSFLYMCCWSLYCLFKKNSGLSPYSFFSTKGSFSSLYLDFIVEGSVFHWYSLERLNVCHVSSCLFLDLPLPENKGLEVINLTYGCYLVGLFPGHGQVKS